MKKLVVITAIFFAFGCSNRPSPESGAVVGAVAGGTVGTIVGHDLGNAGVGAAVGAATGAGVGAVVGSQNPDKKEIIEYQEDVIVGQQGQIRKQGQELNQIKRQEYWDDRLKKHK